MVCGSRRQGKASLYHCTPDCCTWLWSDAAALLLQGVFEEGPGVGPGDGTELEELKDYVMSEMLWDVSLEPDVLITEFLDGYCKIQY